MLTEMFRVLLREELEVIKEEILESLRRTTEESRYLSRKEVSRYLGISLSTVDIYSRVGKLRKIYLGKSVFFDKEEIDELFNQNKKGV